MMSSTAEDAEFPPNPFGSTGEVQQPPPQQQMPVPQQQQQQQPDLNNFYGEAPQPPTNGGAWMQPQPDAFTIEEPTSFQQAGPMDTSMSSSKTTPPPPPPTSRWQRLVSCCSLGSYKAYFDVDTMDVVNRIKGSVRYCYVPDKFRTEIVGSARTDQVKGADLYGPFWITMTLVFLLAVTSNLHAYLNSSTDENFEYDITHLIRAMTVLFTFLLVLPTIVWLLVQCMGMNTGMGIFDWICLYGYSLVIYLPATLLCLIPSEIVVWLSLALATAVSVLLVVRNIASPLLSADVSQTRAAPIIMLVLACHVILLLVLRYAFYYRH